MKVVLIRHFPTKGNRLKQYIGRTDEPLDESAVNEILDEILDEIGDYSVFYPKVDTVVISPMLRCKQTAERIYPGIQTVICENLRETDFGDFEGKTYEELKDQPDYQQWLMSGATGVVPNGESRAEFRERCIAGFQQVIEQLMERNCEYAAVVVHGGTIMALMSEFADETQDFYHWQVKNGKGYIVDINSELWIKGEKRFFNIRKL